MRRTFTPVFATAALLAAACGPSSISVPTALKSATFPKGTVPSQCAQPEYFIVRASECGCPGALAYAVCNVDKYTLCSCADPTPGGYTPQCPTGNGGLSVLCGVGDGGTKDARE